jgi:hypothetical protein
MIDLNIQENYFTCCNCEYCSNIVLHTEHPFIVVGCAKSESYLYDDDKCPLGKWNAED